MTVYERLGIPSPGECIGVRGLTVSLLGLTVGVAALFLLERSFLAFVVIVASLLVGWLSVLYRRGRPSASGLDPEAVHCVVWAESQ